MGLNNSIEKIRGDLSNITEEQKIKILEIFEKEPIMSFWKEVSSLTRDLVDSLIIFSENNHFVQWKIFQVQGYHRQSIIEYEKTLSNIDYSEEIQQNAHLGIWICSIELHQYSKAIESLNIAKIWLDKDLSEEASLKLKNLNDFLGENSTSTKKMFFN